MCTHAESPHQRLQTHHNFYSGFCFLFFFRSYRLLKNILQFYLSTIEIKKNTLCVKKEKRKGTHPKTHRKSATAEPQSQAWSVSKDHTRPVTCEGGVQPDLSGVKLLGFPGGGIVLDGPASHLCPPPPPSHCPKSGVYSLLRPLTPKRLEEGVPSPLRGPRVNSPEGASWVAAGIPRPLCSGDWTCLGLPRPQEQGEACIPLSKGLTPPSDHKVSSKPRFPSRREPV